MDAVLEDDIAIARDLRGIGERLRLAREYGALSQQEFAEHLGYTRRQIIAWESGASPLPIWALMGVRQLCDVDPEWVMFGPGQTPQREIGLPDLDRLPRLRDEVAASARKAGIELTTDAIANLARLIAREAPEAERDASKRVGAMLRAIASRP